MNTRSAWLVGMIALVCCLPTVVGKQDEKQAILKPEMLTLQVRVVDPDGYPVENATVTPFGLRAKAEPGSHYGWSEKRLGLPPKLKTNTDGIVALPYPKYVTEELETGTVTITIEHPDFVVFHGDRSVDDQPAEVQLKIGFRIAATAVDAETGEPIKQDLFGLVSDDLRPTDWRLAENGMLVSPVFEANTVLFRIIKLIPGEPILFSELIEIDPTDRSRVMLRDVKLSRGTRVQGRLDDSIPRPIINGYVSAWIVRSGRSNPANLRGPQWLWIDKAPIAEDGTFVFESMPSDEILQMIPVCDDWVPANPSKEDLMPFFPDQANGLGASIALPQLVRLDGPLVEPILKMDSATSVRVTVVDHDGKPLSGAVVALSPCQYWFQAGTQILGTSSSMSDELIRLRSGAERSLERENRYSAKTDENGVAIIRSMPTNRTELLYAFLEGYEVPLSGNNRYIQIEIKPGEVTEVTIKMQPAGTEVLSDKMLRGDKDD